MLSACSPAEFAFTLKALSLAARDVAKAKRGGLVAFMEAGEAIVCPSEGTTAAGSGRGSKFRGNSSAPQEAEEEEEEGQDALPFPLSIEVQRLPFLPLRTSAFGPPRGRMTLNSSREGFVKALTGEVMSTGGGAGNGGDAKAGGLGDI